MRVVVRLSVSALTLASTAGLAATAPDRYPSRPIRFLVPSAPGGTPDIIARVVGGELAKQMGQQVVVDNRAGANGGIGMHLLTRASKYIPIPPFAPARLSTTTCWPICLLNSAPTTRVMMSGVPPGADGTRKRIGRDG